MRKEGHLEIYELILDVKSPVFIGCGRSYTKKEYVFDPQSKTAAFPDEQRMFTYLAEHGLADAYEDYMVRGMGHDLRDFLLNYAKVPQAQINDWTRCRIDAGDALDEGHSLKEILRFVRDGQNRIYVPGSSIKGALRTILLSAMLKETPPVNPDPNLPFDRRSNIEADYFHTLHLKKDRNQMPDTRNVLNSMLQGLRISDSLPIPDSSLCLAAKIDTLDDGEQNRINICRECIRPGTRIYCTMTLDRTMLQNQLTQAYIEQAITVFSAHYQDTVCRHYPGAKQMMNEKTILLGGGVGFQSKTVTSLYYGNDALKVTVNIMKQKFPHHNHGKDLSKGFSPRALKQTRYHGETCPFGVCEATIR